MLAVALVQETVAGDGYKQWAQELDTGLTFMDGTFKWTGSHLAFDGIGKPWFAPCIGLEG
jgi:hypothetical protein